jgi:hypothetical protein
VWGTGVDLSNSTFFHFDYIIGVSGAVLGRVKLLRRRNQYGGPYSAGGASSLLGRYG